MDSPNPRSTAKIAGHPIHPMTVMFPVVLFVGVLAADIVFLVGGNLFWTTVGVAGLALGLLAAVIAAVFGLIDYLGDHRVRALPAATHHLAANVVVVALEAGNLAMRFNAGPGSVVPGGIALSALAVLVLGYSGWKGASLVYEHGVGVDPRRGARALDRRRDV
jgi:uncharacterized membrane protein